MGLCRLSLCLRSTLYPVSVSNATPAFEIADCDSTIFYWGSSGNEAGLSIGDRVKALPRTLPSYSLTRH